MTTTKKGQAVLVRMVAGKMVAEVAPGDVNLVEWMASRGYPLGTDVGGPHLRKEIRGAPTFVGLCGPMWESDLCPLRYEDTEANNILST